MPKVVEAGGLSIALVHELIQTGMSEDAFPGEISTTFPPERPLMPLLENIFGKRVDVVVFGYTHVPLVEEHHGVLFVNPGSPTMIGQVRKTGTVATLEIAPGKREAKIINLASLSG